MLIHDVITEILANAVAKAQQQSALPETEIPPIVVERPQIAEHGDFACNLPLRLAKAARMNPLEIAEKIAAHVDLGDLLVGAWAAPPGFVNMKLSPTWLQAQVEATIEAGDRFGNTDTGAGRSIQIEFVSVNPTGPVHVGHARGAVLGSALARALAAAGFEVSREYYVNDAGTQMELFYASTFARYAQALGRKGEEIPDNGYQGQYLIEVGQALADEFGTRFLDMERDDAITAIGAVGLDRMLDSIRADLDLIGVDFDVWFREHLLFESGEYDAAMKVLDERGYISKHDGATWFTSTALGDDKDNVVVRSTGQPTYFASDIAYHRNKLEKRGFDRAINIWGADHQGHVTRMKAVLQALDIDPERLTIIISQLVTLKSGGDIVRASKRTGQIVTLADLVHEVGADACRFFFLSRAAESQMEFDMELAKKTSSENPVYYVQYAHARIAGILRQAAERNVTWADGDVSLLTDDAELALVRSMLRLPELIDAIPTTLAPHSLPHYAIELATAFHWFYDHCRVLSSDAADEPIMKARLKLVEAAKVGLARTLTLMGMSTPESM
jgi:arginyl-tRNA synthetase